MSWNTATPAGTEASNQGDDRIREFKSDIQNALRGNDTDGVVAVFPGADLANPTYEYRGRKGVTAARPTPGDNGLYIDTTRNVLQRDNSSTWDDIATLIPAGTKMVFFQAAVPVGWTQVVTENDKALRVVSGTGGGNGGTLALSTGLTHHHATQGHVLLLAEIPSHNHNNGAYTYLLRAHQPATNDTPTGFDGNDSGGSEPDILTKAPISAAGGGGSHDHGDTTDTSPVMAYIDVIVGEKS